MNARSCTGGLSKDGMVASAKSPKDGSLGVIVIGWVDSRPLAELHQTASKRADDRFRFFGSLTSQLGAASAHTIEGNAG